jgi:hypothetical protein
MMYDSRIVRLRPSQMSQITIVIRCGKIFKLRFLTALWLMRVAGRLAGFKSVKLTRER